MRLLSIIAVWLVVLSRTVAADAPLLPDLTRVLTGQAVAMMRVTKSACLIMMGADSSHHINAIDRDFEAFSDAMGRLDTMTSPDPSGQSLEGQSGAVMAAARQIGAGDMNAVPVRLLLQLSEQTAQEFMSLRLETLSQSDTAPERPVLHSAATTDELRFISQQVQKDLCLVQVKIDEVAARARLAKNAARFDVEIAGLIEGSTPLGLPKAPNIQIKVALQRIQRTWKSISQTIDLAVRGDAMDLGDFTLASVLADSVLSDLVNALKEYEKI